ncbi:MAG: GspH/FimT family pseudopilin [Chromatiales bacterium]|nr:GspH/FimT family pseudopilin [Chromatiales bacterium]
MKLNQEILLCPSSNGKNCSDDDDWTVGWLIIDVDGTTAIRVAGALPTGVLVTPSFDDVANVHFSTVGTTMGGAPNFTVTVGAETRYVCLRMSGAAQVSSSSCP